MIRAITNPSHDSNLIALRRIEGQVRGVQRMIEDRKYCIDILNQICAIKGALGRVEERILIESCVTQAFQGTSEDEKQEKLDEILKLINKTRRG